MIVLQGVSKTYPNGVAALRDISIDIPEREFAFLVGPSGAGKSTFIKLLIRDEVASKGRVFVNGQDVGRLKRRQVPHFRRKIGVVFQDFKLLPYKTVRENVAFPLQVHGILDWKVMNPQVEACLEMVGLPDCAERFPTQLSGGEQQRVAIARGLIHHPLLLIADEPTGNLDPDTGWEIVQLLIKINAFGTTVLMATHNREVVDMLRRRVIHIDHGAIVRDEHEGAYHAA
ncbi:MAG TPA: cell division ATP-binding protein FtsE [Chloroflexota bacterium]|nr:cell division ATP-binding protein FtsE [Chloroflexota bacterium]